MKPSEFELISGVGRRTSSPARVDKPTLPVVRVGAVQCEWNEELERHLETLSAGIGLAADSGARVVCLQELTLSPYFPVRPDVDDALERFGEDPLNGPTTSFAREMAIQHRVVVHASLYEKTDDGRGFNTAICVDLDGRLIARTRKIHIPRFPGYHENLYFEPGDSGYPVVGVAGARFGFPTCWDQWFPELARIYSMEGAEVLVFPTAIGSEQAFDDFDSQPFWEQIIAANGLANATFMVAVNRIGLEGPTEFYGSSFISDPYGRVIVSAPRDRRAVLVADLDLNQRRDWLSFGLMDTREPAAYSRLTEVGPDKKSD